MKIYSYVESSDKCTKKPTKSLSSPFFVILTPFGPENYYHHGVFDKNRRKNINNVEVYKKTEKALTQTYLKLPLRQWGASVFTS